MNVRRAKPLERLDEACPILTRSRLTFDCPVHEKCRGGRVEIPVSTTEAVGAWTRSGMDFGTMTIMPSIRRRGACGWHGLILDGRFEHCEDSV